MRGCTAQFAARDRARRGQPDPVLTGTVALVSWLASDESPCARWRRRRQRRRRIVRAVARRLFVVGAVVFAFAAFGSAARWAIGGLVLVLSAACVLAAIVGLVAWALRALRTRRLRDPALLVASETVDLPTRTRAWIEAERPHLPGSAQVVLQGISQRLEALAPQLRATEAPAEETAELRRLLAEELPELVRSYRKLPATLTGYARYGGATPERQLSAGLAIIDAQLARAHERLGERDLHALATQLQYLSLKYDSRDGDAP